METSEEAHRQYRWLMNLRKEQLKKPKPKLVIREIPEPTRGKHSAAQSLQTPED